MRAAASKRPVFERHAFVCTTGSSCPGDGPALEVHKALKKAASGRLVRINQSGCLDQCGHGPLVVVYPEGVWYSHVSVQDAARIAQEHLLGGTAVEDLRYVTARRGKNKVTKGPGPVGPDNPAVLDGTWEPCTRCPPGLRPSRAGDP
jgi:(2Fe-2S) ferredoxin